MRIRQMGPSEEKKELTGAGQSIDSVVVFPNQMIATGSLAEISIWDSNDFSLIKTLKGHSDFIESLAVMNDNLLVSGCVSDSSIIIWNVTSDEKIREFKIENFISLAVLSENR